MVRVGTLTGPKILACRTFTQLVRLYRLAHSPARLTGRARRGGPPPWGPSLGPCPITLPLESRYPTPPSSIRPARSCANHLSAGILLVTDLDVPARLPSLNCEPSERSAVSTSPFPSSPDRATGRARSSTLTTLPYPVRPQKNCDLPASRRGRSRTALRREAAAPPSEGPASTTAANPVSRFMSLTPCVVVE